MVQGSASAFASRATIDSGNAIASASATGAGTGAAKTVMKRERATIAAVKRMLFVFVKGVDSFG